METSIQHGEVTFLHELPQLLAQMKQQPQQQSAGEKAVRVLGRCVAVDPQERRALLAAARGPGQQPQVAVDTALLHDVAFALDGLYQVIGELRAPDEQQGPPQQQEGEGKASPALPLLRARVARCVDGLDVSLYEQAVRIRRAFLQSTALALPVKGEAAEA